MAAVQHAVFLSHSSHDKETADAVCAALEASGVPCWVAPRDIPPGVEWSAAIVRALHHSRLLLLLLTDASNDSPQVLREVERAVALRVPLLTLRLQAVELSPGLEYFVSIAHWLDAVEDASSARFAWLPTLVDNVQAALRQNPAPASPSAPAPASVAPHTSRLGTELPPTNLPARLGGFIGRDGERSALVDLLTPVSTVRLVTVAGMGGMGKTRLAQEVAHDLLNRQPPPFPDGVFLAELTPLTDPALVPKAVAQALDVPESGSGDVLSALVTALKDRRLLLLLDNCEHLLSACAVLASALLRDCPQVRILATSRSRLGISGEQAVALNPLPVPGESEDAGAATALVAEANEAARLFVQRAQAVQGDFALTAQNAADILRICRRLDGIPLALELAAARVRALTPHQIAGRLDERFRLLTGGSRDMPPHQQTLRALIDWSYDLLTPPERTLLARLSVFADGWTLEDAEAVCAADGEVVDPWEVLDLLLALVDRSLVVFERERYRLLETVRAYAAERLAESGEQDRMRARHAAFFLTLAEDAAPRLRGADQAAWLQRLSAEMGNLRAAFAAAAGPGERLRFAAALHWFWYIRGHLREGMDRLSEALAAGGPDGDREENAAARGTALHGAGLLASELGRAEEARRYYGRALAVRRALDDVTGEATTLNNLGVVALSEYDLPAARDFWEQSIRLSEAAGREETLSGPLSNLGLVTVMQGDYAAAQALFDRAREKARALGERFREVEVQVCDAYARLMQGDLGGARACAGDGLRVARELGYPWYEREALVVLAGVERWQGDMEAARGRLREVEAVERAIDPKAGASFVLLTETGDLARASGDLPKASELYAQALEAAVSEDARDPRLLPLFEALGAVATAQKAPGHAARFYGWAAGVRTRYGMPVPPVLRDEVERDRAALQRTLGDADFAEAWAAGGAMTTDQALAFARGGGTEETPAGDQPSSS